MLSAIESGAGLAGLAVSLSGLEFATLQLRKLLGETPAARGSRSGDHTAVLPVF